MTLCGDTVAAIATAPGRGGVAIVRVSGPDAFRIAETLTGRKPQPERIAVRRVGLGRTVDECVVLCFRAPRSYTGEDVIEFQCHGGAVTPRRILEACFAAGARLAERGEFTFRALMNGRLTVEAAEGVLDLVNARTDRAADDALARLDGTRAHRHRALYDKAVELSARLEHALDIDEAELPGGYVDGMTSEIGDLCAEIAQALAKVREGKILRDGARVVLAGAPNAGKSSLMNALLAENRAIVSATPGTTRDVIEETLDVDGWPVRLFDTAGLRETDDVIEREGVSRANDLIAKADLVLALDCDIPGAIRVHAKCDLDLRAAEPPNAGAPATPIAVSAKTGEGLDALRQTIVARIRALVARADNLANEGDCTAALLHEALQSLLSAPGDLLLLANAVRSCSEALGRLVGATYAQDMLDALFSRFCVGK